jgi:hypothetical protein
MVVRLIVNVHQDRTSFVFTEEIMLGVRTLCILILSSFLLLYPCVAIVALAVEDGTYDAEVQTDSGTYSVPVEVENGEVTEVHWPNGGNMHVEGAEIENGEATGTNSRGDSVQIQIDDSE